jgi:hypothetical protein
MSEADDDDSESERGARARALDETVVDEVIARTPSLPEPLAALALEIEIARDDGDATGVRKLLYELAVGVARYALSVGLAAFAASSPDASAPGPLADAMRRAFKLTDGRWLELVRLSESALRRTNPQAASCLRFAASSKVNAMVTSRNAFIHGGGSGDDAPERTRDTLEAAAELLALPLRVVAASPAGSLEIRHGVPKRRGVWRKSDADVSVALEVGRAFVMIGGKAVVIDPWLPVTDGTLRLVDSPHAPGRSWRCIFPETGEHPEHAGFDAAVRALVGDDGKAPRPPVDRPPMVGRALELSLAARAMSEAAAGTVRAVLVSGVQGAGLSRMLAEAVSAAGGFGIASVIEVFGSSDRRTPFAALRLALQGTTDAALDAFRSAVEKLASSDQVADRARLDAEIEAIEETLVDGSRRSSVLLAVEDAQWLDEHTLALLRLIAERANRGAKGRLVLLIAARVEASPTPGLAQLMLQIDRDVGSGATRIPLAALDEDAARKLVQGVAPFAPSVAERVVQGASGLPFYIVQPLHVWVETGAFEWANGLWSCVPDKGDKLLAQGVPGLAQLVDTRLASLFDAGSDAAEVAHFVLACVATDGAPTPVARLTRVLERMEVDGALGTRVLDMLLGAGIVVRRDTGRIAVPQPIVAQALASRYRESAWWPRLARVVLAALEQEPVRVRDAEKIALGFEALGEDELALRWYREAVLQRTKQGAFEQARALAELLALRETTDQARLAAELAAVDAMARNGKDAAARERHAAVYVPRDPRLELEWKVAGEILSIGAGRPATTDVDALVAEADVSGDASLRLNARLALARRRRGQAARDAVKDALSILDVASLANDSDTRYRLLALDLELVYESREGGIDELRTAAARARAAAARLGSTWAELDAENDVAILESDLGDIEGAIRRLLDVSARAASAHYGSLRRLTLTNAAALVMRAGRPAEARVHARLAEDEARAAGDGRFLAVALSIRSETELLLDEPEAALRAISECIELREQAGEKNVVVALVRRADARGRLGDPSGARADGELALARATEGKNADLTALAQLWLGIDDVKREAEGARAALHGLVDALTAIQNRLRGPTLRKLDDARALLVAARA